MPGLRRTTAAKRLSGTARRDREPRPDYIARLTEPPEAPRALAPEARRIWRELASAAVGIGTLTCADLPLLMLLTTTLEQEAIARRELVADGNAIAAGSGGPEAPSSGGNCGEGASGGGPDDVAVRAVAAGQAGHCHSASAQGAQSVQPARSHPARRAGPKSRRLPR